MGVNSLPKTVIRQRLYVHSVDDSTLMSILDQFRFLLLFWGCQQSAIIDILKTLSGSISFNSWLRCYRIV